MAKAFNRVSPKGIKFMIRELPNAETRIELRDDFKHIDVKFPISLVMESWNTWAVEGRLIYAAFPYLTASERDFILLGIIESEWDRLFGATE